MLLIDNLPMQFLEPALNGIKEKFVISFEFKNLSGLNSFGFSKYFSFLCSANTFMKIEVPGKIVCSSTNIYK